ncbi:MAG: hypothetical protein V1743_06135, partial [Nanoarchaeota archaeon]
MPDAEEKRIKRILGKLGTGMSDSIKYSDWNMKRQAGKQEKELRKQQLEQEHLQAQAAFNSMKGRNDITHQELYEAKQRQRQAKAALNQANPWKKPFSAIHRGTSGLMEGLALRPTNRPVKENPNAYYNYEWDESVELVLLILAALVHIVDVFFLKLARGPTQ